MGGGMKAKVWKEELGKEAGYSSTMMGSWQTIYKMNK